jgi:hypothetical protein
LHCNPCKTRAIDVVYRCEIRSSRKWIDLAKVNS